MSNSNKITTDTPSKRGPGRRVKFVDEEKEDDLCSSFDDTDLWAHSKSLY